MHAVEGLNWTVSQAGMFFAYLSLAMVLVQGPVLAKAATLFSDEVLAVTGALILAAGFAALYWDGNAAVYVAGTAIALGNGLLWPTVLAMLSRAAGGEHQGAVQEAGGSVGRRRQHCRFDRRGACLRLDGRVGLRVGGFDRPARDRAHFCLCEERRSSVLSARALAGSVRNFVSEACFVIG